MSTSMKIKYTKDILIVGKGVNNEINDQIVYLVTQYAPISKFYFLNSFIVFEREGIWQDKEIEFLEKTLGRIGITKSMKAHQMPLPIQPLVGKDLQPEKETLNTKLRKWFRWIIPLLVFASILIYVEGLIIYDTLTRMNK